MAGRLQKYTRIKNEVLELLAKSDLPGRQLKIVLLIIRESWGWNAGRSNWTHKPFTITEIAQRLGIGKENISREIRALIRRNILQINKGEMGTYYSFNEHQNTWYKSDEVVKNARGCQKRNKKLSKTQHRPPSNLQLTRVSPILKKDLKKDLLNDTY